MALRRYFASGSPGVLVFQFQSRVSAMPEMTMTSDDILSMTAPGKVLRDAREAAGVSQSEVAKRLRLSMQCIKDIEADDYSHFSAIIYVSGYIRNYAALFGLDAAPLLLAFHHMGFADQVESYQQTSVTSMVQRGVQRTIQINRVQQHMARWAGAMLALGLLALVIIWWTGQHHHAHANVVAEITPVTTGVQTSLPIQGVTAKAHSHVHHASRHS